jgi:hypothetical protein
MTLKSFFLLILHYLNTCVCVCVWGGVFFDGHKYVKITVGETDCEVQKWNEMAWSRVYCMGSVLQVLRITRGWVAVVVWFVWYFHILHSMHYN